MIRKILLLTYLFAITAVVVTPYRSFAMNDTSSKIRISIIMVKEKSKAEEILDKLKRGEDFTILAKEYSLDSNAQKGGDVGYFSKGDLISELDKVAFQLKGGEVSGIIGAATGYFIIKRTDLVASRPTAEDAGIKEVKKVIVTESRAPIPKVKMAVPVERVEIIPKKQEVETITPKEECDKLYVEAVQHFNSKNINPALAGFKRIIELYPDHELSGNAHYFIGEIYYLRRLYKEAVNEFDQVITRYPKSEKVAAAFLKKGLSSYHLGNKHEAKILLEKIIETYPDSKEADYAQNSLKLLIFPTSPSVPHDTIEGTTSSTIKVPEEGGHNAETSSIDVAEGVKKDENKVTATLIDKSTRQEVESNISVGTKEKSSWKQETSQKSTERKIADQSSSNGKIKTTNVAEKSATGVLVRTKDPYSIVAVLIFIILPASIALVIISIRSLRTAGIYLRSGRRIDFPKLLIKAEQALGKGELDKAQKCYEKVIKALRT